MMLDGPDPQDRIFGFDRRRFIKGVGATLVGGFAFAGYAFGIEPRYRLKTTRYALSPPGWPKGMRLKITCIADIHAGEPYMPPRRIAEIVARTNAEKPDLVVLLGDYVASHRWQTRIVPPEEWAAILADLKAPLGVHAVLGNHDWWHDEAVQKSRRGPVAAHRALSKVGIPVYENDAVRLVVNGRPFWLAGLGDQLAFSYLNAQGKRLFEGVHDVDATMRKVTDDAPVIMVAHEPDVFPNIPPRVALTLSGHTHGGQVRLFGFSPVVPSRYGNRYAYGHVVEDDRHMLVSGGLGCSILPVRLGIPPEIVTVELGA